MSKPTTMKRSVPFSLAISLLGICLFFLAFHPPTTTITIKGSDTMLILVQRWAEAYMKGHPGVSIQVTGGGTGSGMEALIGGLVDVCDASRQMSKGEIAELKQRFSIPGVEIPCARDGITIYLNKENPVSTLTLDQISGIFSGRITSWRQVGGINAPIHLYGRETNSGTYVVFKEMVVKTDYSRQCLMLPGNAAIVSAVMKDPHGIGYGGAAFVHGVKRCFVQTDTASHGYQATLSSMDDGLYPISRYLYLYTRNRPTGELKAFINWVLGPEGQKMVTELEYFPLK